MARELNPPDVAERPQKFRRLPSANVYVKIAATGSPETFADTRRAGLEPWLTRGREGRRRQGEGWGKL